jgi:hypothetical protein
MGTSAFIKTREGRRWERVGALPDSPRSITEIPGDHRSRFSAADPVYLDQKVVAKLRKARIFDGVSKLRAEMMARLIRQRLQDLEPSSFGVRGWAGLAYAGRFFRSPSMRVRFAGMASVPC